MQGSETSAKDVDEKELKLPIPLPLAHKSFSTHANDLERGRPELQNRSLTNQSVKSARSKVETLPDVSELRRVTTNLDTGIIAWDSETDPLNPQNWSPFRKWMAVIVFSICTFVTPLASSMFAPAVLDASREFDSHSSVILSLMVSVFVVGYAAGPLVLSPLSEMYGRAPVLHFSNILFTVFQIACARAHSANELIVYRFLAGLGGSGPLTLGGGVIADVFPPEVRGKAVAFYSLGPLLGPVIGPIAGGFVSQYIGWRFVFWILLIAGTIMTGLAMIFLQETNAVVILERKTRKMQKQLKRPELRSAFDRGLPKSQQIKTALVRPIKMLLFSPIVFLMSLYMALIYGLLYLLFTTLSNVFIGQYGFTTGTSGLAYLGIGSGFLFGLFICGKLSDKIMMQLTAKNGGVRKPEFRLPLMVVGSLLLPIGLFVYGWSAKYKVHWIVPIIGLAPFGIGMMCAFLPIQTYLIDAFSEYAASAIAAATVLRSLFGAFLPLAGPPMYRALGLGWGNSVLALAAILFAPVPLVFWRYGERIRQRFPVDLD